ncbi:Non-catalytic module family DOC2 [Piromyces sp. E2]|nr:Non-catalytic module family DOC2 [Piromyces sp. E2]|eukprot:OUM67070.1 Non-catalytic module family DOC2 [Piromyces sp. E2]
MCGTPDPNDPLAGNANAKTTLPDNFPFLKDSGYQLPGEEGSDKTTTKKTSTTTKSSEPTNTETCWSEKLGFKCCSGCNSVYTDKDGDWGLENGDWCGILKNCSAATTTCTGYPDYPCCNSCDVAFSDATGDWGVENDTWCGIKTSCKPSNATPTTCFSEPDYPCCKSTCEVADTDENGKWGIEDGNWCGIPDTCPTSTKNKRGGFTILPICHNPLPTCVALYDQCGGDGYFGPTECCKGKCISQGP